MLKKIIVCALLIVPVLAFAKGKDKEKEKDKDVAALQQWETTYQAPSSDLGTWVIDHPAAAKLFFEWDGKHPAKAKEFVTWTIAKPNENVDMFVAANPTWPLFDKIVVNHKPAVESFVDWCRKHPKAAEELMSHPKGLHWVGHHTYKAYWNATK